MLFFYIILALVLLYLAVSLYMTMLLFRRKGVKPNLTKKLGEELDRILEPYRAITDAGTKWLSETNSETVYITSSDGLKLKARVYENPQARAVLIGFHGYRSGCLNDFAGAGRFYFESGFTLILPDHRAGGESEGKYITFGIKESDDAVKWAEYAKERYEKLPAVLAGISMGAATVMMAAEKAPDNVKAILEDCGYDDPCEEIAFVCNKDFKGAAILLPGVRMFCRLICGFSLKSKTASASVKKSGLPLFIAHGGDDGIVPITSAFKIKEACKDQAKLFTAESAGHGMSYLVDTDGYKRALTAFLNENVFI